MITNFITVTLIFSAAIDLPKPSQGFSCRWFFNPTPRFVAQETATFTNHRILHTGFSKSQNHHYRFHKILLRNNNNRNYSLAGYHFPLAGLKCPPDRTGRNVIQFFARLHFSACVRVSRTQFRSFVRHETRRSFFAVMLTIFIVACKRDSSPSNVRQNILQQ